MKTYSLRAVLLASTGLLCLILAVAATPLGAALDTQFKFITLQELDDRRVAPIPESGAETLDPEILDHETTVTTVGARTTGVTFLEMVALFDLGTCESGTGYFLYGPSRNSMHQKTTAITLPARAGVLAPFATNLYSDTRYFFTPVIEACEFVTLGTTGTALTRKAPIISATTTVESVTATDEEPTANSIDTTPPVNTTSADLPVVDLIDSTPNNTPLSANTPALEISIENGVEVVRPDDALTYVNTIFNLGSSITSPLEVIIELPDEVRFLDTNLGRYENADHTVRTTLDALPADTLAQIVVETNAVPDAADGDLVTAQINVLFGDSNLRAFDYDEYRTDGDLPINTGPASAGRGFLPSSPWGWIVASLILIGIVAVGRFALLKRSVVPATAFRYRGTPYEPQNEPSYPYTPSLEPNPKTETN